jgi:hydrogenase expression/formation protein HypC
MCLTIPGQVVKVEGPEAGPKTATVEYRGLSRKANLLYAPEVKVGDYVIVQAGFVIRRLAEVEALEALEYARQIDQMEPAPAPTAPRAKSAA